MRKVTYTRKTWNRVALRKISPRFKTERFIAWKNETQSFVYPARSFRQICPSLFDDGDVRFLSKRSPCAYMRLRFSWTRAALSHSNSNTNTLLPRRLYAISSVRTSPRVPAFGRSLEINPKSGGFHTGVRVECYHACPLSVLPAILCTAIRACYDELNILYYLLLLFFSNISNSFSIKKCTDVHV